MNDIQNIKGVAKKFLTKKMDTQEEDGNDLDLSSFGSYINSFESLGSTNDVDYRQDALKNISFRKP
ncbi:hypothetical protein BKI52_37175 [marine bacterium AO1-C]|nr:hypothetical protein BKI52_37175 [marine bacterium AO1-C]